jgi:hypothetical protein
MGPGSPATPKQRPSLLPQLQAPPRPALRPPLTVGFRDLLGWVGGSTSADRAGVPRGALWSGCSPRFGSPSPGPARLVVKRLGIPKNPEGDCGLAHPCCSLCSARLLNTRSGGWQDGPASCVSSNTRSPFVFKKSALTNINLGCIHLLALTRVFGTHIYQYQL